MKIIQTLLVLLGGLFPFILNAGTTEDIYFSHIGMEDGLSHSTIFAINQDKEGNLWFATYDGVNKYDGYNFTVYRHEYANPNSIAVPSISQFSLMGAMLLMGTLMPFFL